MCGVKGPQKRGIDMLFLVRGITDPWWPPYPWAHLVSLDLGVHLAHPCFLIPVPVSCVQKRGINMLFVIGGNGTHAGANAIHHEVSGQAQLAAPPPRVGAPVSAALHWTSLRCNRLNMGQHSKELPLPRLRIGKLVHHSVPNLAHAAIGASLWRHTVKARCGGTL